MTVYYSCYYLIGVKWSPLHPGHPVVPEVTLPDYIISTWQTDNCSVRSRTNKSTKLLEKYCNAVGCCYATITAIMEPLQ